METTYQEHKFTKKNAAAAAAPLYESHLNTLIQELGTNQDGQIKKHGQCYREKRSKEDGTH